MITTPERDPRVDPLPGDLFSIKYDRTLLITRRDGARVFFKSYPAGVETSMHTGIQWARRIAAATIIKRGDV